jgi:hypothetical protein
MHIETPTVKAPHGITYIIELGHIAILMHPYITMPINSVLVLIPRGG